METSIISITKLTNYPCYWVAVAMKSTCDGAKPSLELKVAVPSNENLTFEEIEQQAKVNAIALLKNCITHLG